MPNTLSPDDHAALESLLAEFGSAVTTGIHHADPAAVAAAMLMQHARFLVADAAANDSVSIRKLAQRLGVSASAVSRALNSDGDIRLGTLAAFAHALGREWEMRLRPIDHSQHQAVNFRKIVPSAGAAPGLVLGEVQLVNQQ